MAQFRITMTCYSINSHIKEMEQTKFELSPFQLNSTDRDFVVSIMVLVVVNSIVVHSYLFLGILRF